jgi:hypothetical protein
VSSLAKVLNRWLSPRALMLHAAGAAWVAGCVLAADWQVGRAIQGNEFSYLYAIEWPVFALAGIVGWWALVHTDAKSSGERAVRREADAALRARAHVARRDRTVEDAELAAYNDHLAELAATNRPKGWRR